MYTLITVALFKSPYVNNQEALAWASLTYGLNPQFGVSEPEHRVSWQGKHSINMDDELFWKNVQIIVFLI